MHTMLRLLAAAALIAGTARAQTLPNPNAPTPRRPAPAPRASPPTASPPATAAPSTTPSAASSGTGSSSGSSDPGASATAKPLGEDLKRMVNEMHARNHGEITAAQLAMQKAESPDVKSLASKLNNDRTQISVQLDQLAKTRGMASLAAPTAEAQRQSQAVTSKMSGMQAGEFDRTYLAEVIKDTEQDETALKKMRDAAPGNDPQLKGTLDNLENVIEGDLSAARQAKVKLDQGRAAARRPH